MTDAPTARCPFCGITWAAWPGSSHSCSPLQNALGVTTGADPPDTPAAERLRRLEAVREAALVVIDNGHGPHGFRPTMPCKCGWDELRCALDAVDAP